jgi:hypothetical protein
VESVSFFARKAAKLALVFFARSPKKLDMIFFARNQENLRVKEKKEQAFRYPFYTFFFFFA